MQRKMSDKFGKILFLRISSAYVVMFFRTLAFVLAVAMGYLILTDWHSNQGLISPLGILIAALLASFSVVHSIDTNMLLQNKEFSNKVRYLFFRLCQAKTILLSLQQEKNKEKITDVDLDRILITIEGVNEILTETCTENAVSVINNSVLVQVHFLVLRVGTLHNGFRAVKANLVKAAPQKDSMPRLPNPLRLTSCDLETIIADLSQILGYMKEGYKKDFPEMGAIGDCASYENFSAENP